MPKRRLKIRVRIPEYSYPSCEWRRQIHKEFYKEIKKRKIQFHKEDKLQLGIRLYFDDVKLSFVDVDNRLKDIMDALQGRSGGSGKKPKLAPIIPNDSQIYRVVVEKGRPPIQSLGLGHLTISKYTDPVYR